MSNLFFIHTPFQLFVSQQIINQEKLKDNIMVYGYHKNNTQFLKIYDAIRIDHFWTKRCFLESIDGWALFSFKGILSNYKRALNGRKFLKSIIESNNVNTVYVGDINNLHYQLLVLYYSAKGYTFCNFEEGSSHYFNSTHITKYGKSYIKRAKQFISDIVYYLPIWGVAFGKYVYFQNMDYSQLPFKKRYSILPFYHDSIDTQLFPQLLLSNSLQEYLECELKMINQTRSMLFLSEPVDEISSNKSKLELLTLKEYLLSECEKRTVVVKFHPREDVDKRSSVIGVFEDLNIPYIVVSKELNIPVEYYLQYVRFEKIVTYMCSTVIYNGYIFPKTDVVSLLPLYYKLCLEYKSEYVSEVKKMLDSNLYKIMFENGSC